MLGDCHSTEQNNALLAGTEFSVNLLMFLDKVLTWLVVKLNPQYSQAELSTPDAHTQTVVTEPGEEEVAYYVVDITIVKQLFYLKNAVWNALK